MFYQILKYPYAIKRHLNAPLLDDRLAYLQYWADNGASQDKIRTTAQYLLHIINDLHLKNKK